jgi:hypothetical protein
MDVCKLMLADTAFLKKNRKFGYIEDLIECLNLIDFTAHWHNLQKVWTHSLSETIIETFQQIA